MYALDVLPVDPPLLVLRRVADLRLAAALPVPLADAGHGEALVNRLFLQVDEAVEEEGGRGVRERVDEVGELLEAAETADDRKCLLDSVLLLLGRPSAVLLGYAILEELLLVVVDVHLIE